MVSIKSFMTINFICYISLSFYFNHVADSNSTRCPDRTQKETWTDLCTRIPKTPPSNDHSAWRRSFWNGIYFISLEFPCKSISIKFNFWSLDFLWSVFCQLKCFLAPCPIFSTILIIYFFLFTSKNVTLLN